MSITNYAVAADFLRRQLLKKNQVMSMQNERCELCEGELEQRQVLARFRYKWETICIEHVPAWVCRHCGEQYYDEPIYKQIERIA